MEDYEYEIVEVVCPRCNCDMVEPLRDSKWKCCTCGEEFQQNYEKEEGD